jgi:ABC-2 type transport system permease protein
VSLSAILNVVVWTAVFGAGAVWRFRRDTSRV